jgi:hypothetical protein
MSQCRMPSLSDNAGSTENLGTFVSKNLTRMMKGITSFHDKKKPYELPDGPLETKHIHDKLFDDQPHSHQQILIDQDCIHQCEQQTLHESQHSVPRQCV